MGQILLVTLRWSFAWTILGTIVGIAMMLGKVPPRIRSQASTTSGSTLFGFPSSPWLPAFLVLPSDLCFQF